MESKKEDLQKELLELILEGDKEKAISILDNYSSEFGYSEVITDLLDPCLVAFGKEWGCTERVSLGQGYILSKIVEDTYNKYMSKESLTKLQNEQKGPIVIGNIIDDSHSLGRKLIITFLKINGWKVIDLGDDVDPEDFIEAAIEENAPIIAVSAMMLRTALNIKKVREEIDKKGLTDRVKLAVGGAVFTQRPAMVQEVGADGTALNAIKTPELMERLLSELKR